MMLPIIRAVCHASTELTPPPSGILFDGRHDQHVLGCHLRARGRYVFGREDIEVEGPYLDLLAAGETDRNLLRGAFELHYCLFEWPGIVGGPGPNVTVRIGDAVVQRSHIRPLSGREATEAVALFRRLRALWMQPDLGTQLRATALVLELLALWHRPATTARGREPVVMLYRCLIEQHAHQAELSLESLARRVGRNPYYLAELFRREIGMTPVEYRTRLRLARARDLLASTTMPVARVAAETGFADANYFARVFRRHVGSTPRRFSLSARRNAS